MTKEQQLREIDEAYEAGLRALQCLNEATSHIGNARGLGIWDMFGGGFFSGIMKHSQMDAAQRCLERAQYELRSFYRELSDLNMQRYLNVSFDGFTKFVDIFCDNFLVDMMVQSQISNVNKQLEDAKFQVGNILDQLANMRRSLLNG